MPLDEANIHVAYLPDNETARSKKITIHYYINEVDLTSAPLGENVYYFQEQILFSIQNFKNYLTVVRIKGINVHKKKSIFLDKMLCRNLIEMSRD